MARQWYEHPSLIMQVKSLTKVRDELREDNLHEQGGIRPDADPGEPDDRARRARTPDGTFNDLSCPYMGAQGTGFGRNFPLDMTAVDTKRLLEPDPRLISRTLMARDEFKPAGIINSLAAAWLQFQNHNWL